MSENNELHWLVNTEPLNMHFTLHFAAPKMPIVFSGQALDPIQNEKTATCPFDAFSSALLMDHLEGRRRAGIYCRSGGEKNPASPKIPIQHPVNIEGRAGTLCAVSCWVPLRLPPPHLFPGPSASVRWDFSERHPGGGQEAERGWPG